MFLSIIVPVFNEEQNIVLLYEQSVAVLEKLDSDFELIFINDGCRDNSPNLMDQLAESDNRIRVIHFRRNYGQTAAIMAGFQNSQGDVVIPMDGDLQNDPKDIPRLLAKLDQGYDVVSGWRKDRQDKAVSRLLPSVIANRLISKLLGVPLHDYGCTLKAYRRDVIKDVRLYGEMHRFIPIYASWEGAQVTELPVIHHARRFGNSKYGINRAPRVILDLILLYFIRHAFDRPIQFFGKAGLYSLALAFLVGFTTVLLKLFDIRDFVETPLPLLVVTLGIAGLLFILMGILAEMQTRTYYESRNRFPYAIRHITNPTPPPPEGRS